MGSLLQRSPPGANALRWLNLVPSVSRLTPAYVHESRLLPPSMRWVCRHLDWWLGIVVEDTVAVVIYLSCPFP